MKIIIKGEPKEIAALVLELQGRRESKIDVNKIADAARKTLESYAFVTENTTAPVERDG